MPARPANAFATGSRAVGLSGRIVRVGLVAGVVLCAAAGPALAQLTDEDIAALRERGKAEGWTFTVGRNGATEYSLDELCGAVEPPGWAEPVFDDTSDQRGGLPAAWDWRDHNGCTPIRNQGGCGSCWAFAAVGAVECSILINEGWSTNLSEQWLVSCTNAGSCSGGWHSSALGYLICGDNWFDYCGDCGPVPESEFPYVAWDAPCGCPYSHPYTIENWGYAGGDTNIERIKQAIYDHGPVAVTVAVNSAFQGYDDGVFNACWDGALNHAVVLVGWDDNQGSNGVWILRNSWGTWWGEGGYMWIEYGCSRVGSNACFVEYRRDCNDNGIPDTDEIANGTAEDCNGNGVPDECDIASGASTDCNENGIPDDCEIGRTTIIYVDQFATGNNTGLSWEDALTDLEAAYCFTQTNTGVAQIWVAHGTYTPAPYDGSREASFRLVSGVAIRGSFAGYETSLDERDLSNPANRTILSGDLLGDDEPGFVNRVDNSYHVVRGDGCDATAILDGFTIAGGHANAFVTHNHGAGMYNAGGSPTVTNCVFVGNYALVAGGGMSNEWGLNGLGSSPTIINCVFSGNQSGAYGGAMCMVGEFTADANPVVVNCSMVGNTSTTGGGVYSGAYSVPTLVNCVLWNNSDAVGTGEDAQLQCNAVDVSYCCVQGWTGDLGGVANIGGDPSLADADGADDLVGTLDDNLRLNPGSPCIDAGDNLSVPDGVDGDLDGNPRFVDDPGMPDHGNAPGGEAVVDMGAYEFQGSTCFGDLNGDNQVNLADLSLLLAHYGATSGASYADGDLDGNGTVDLADLSELLSRYGDSCA
jgi:hypothetical protein